MKKSFKVLETGNFYFPISEKGKEFKIKDTYTLEINDKNVVNVIKEAMKLEIIDLSFIARIIYEECKKMNLDKECKKGWIVPCRFSFFGEDKIEVFVDVLQPV